MWKLSTGKHTIHLIAIEALNKIQPWSITGLNGMFVQIRAATVTIVVVTLFDISVPKKTNKETKRSTRLTVRVSSWGKSSVSPFWSSSSCRWRVAAHAVPRPRCRFQPEGTSGWLFGGQRLQWAAADCEDGPPAHKRVSPCRHCWSWHGRTDGRHVTAGRGTRGTRRGPMLQSSFWWFRWPQGAEKRYNKLMGTQPPQIAGLRCSYVLPSAGSLLEHLQPVARNVGVLFFL